MRSPVAEVGRVKASTLPAVTVARSVLHGDYSGLGAAWPELKAWIRAQGRESGAGLWESYRLGPETSPNPVDWRTDLICPLVG